jgi:hypothetical protein
MRDRLFDRPVFIKDGKILTREIASVMDALDYLEEMPEECRDLAYETVVRACWDVLDDVKPLVAAEKAFRRFAKRCGVLEDPGVLPWMTAPGSSGGQLSA